MTQQAEYWPGYKPEKLLEWWDDIQNVAKGDRATLRRCQTRKDIISQSAFYRFLNAVADQALQESGDLLPLVAGLLAHVKDHVQDLSKKECPIFLALGKSKKGRDLPVMSELRFQNLLQSKDPDEFYQHMRRALALLDGKTDIIALIKVIDDWVLQYQSDSSGTTLKQSIQFKWAKAYYLH